MEPSLGVAGAALDGKFLTLDFAGMAAVIAIKRNATLELDDLIIRGFASRHVTSNRGLLAYRVPALGPWPSILAEPGAYVSHYSLLLMRDNTHALAITWAKADQGAVLCCQPQKTSWCVGIMKVC